MDFVCNFGAICEILHAFTYLVFLAPFICLHVYLIVLVSRNGVNFKSPTSITFTTDFLYSSLILSLCPPNIFYSCSCQVAFLRYIQQWKKKIVFVLNKSDLYRSADEVWTNVYYSIFYSQLKVFFSCGHDRAFIYP